jgi:hypothetical protein
MGQYCFLCLRRRATFARILEAYQQDCVGAIRDLILALANHAQQQGKIAGICLRAINDNDRTEQLLTDLRLPANQIEIVKFYGTGGQGMMVKQAIAQRVRPQLPYLFMVTSKARMGDQFPSDVHYFIDFAQQASDLNALLQGLVGRACGYGKDSLVVLSDRNHLILDNYLSTNGDYVMTPSRHSVVAGGMNGVAPRSQITIERNPADATLEGFFKDLDRQIVQPMVPIGPAMKPIKAPRGGRRGAILALANGHLAFDHVETPAFRKAYLPNVFGFPEIVRLGETILLLQADGSTIQGSYLVDDAGNCRFNFRKDVACRPYHTACISQQLANGVPNSCNTTSVK